MGDRKSYAHIDIIKTARSLGNRCRHNLQTGERYKKEHVNSEQIANNRMLVGSWNDDYYRLAVERFTSQKFKNDKEWLTYKKEHPKIGDMYYEDGGKVRKNAVIAAEVVMPYPGEMLTGKDDERYPADNDKYEKWVDNTVKYVKDKFGEKNVLSVVLHVDEQTPHIHAIVTPVVEKEKGLRLDMHNYVNGKKGCARFQTEYARAIGFQRGVKDLNAKYDDVKKAKAMLTKALDNELPEPKKGQSAKEYKEEADELYKTACVKLQDAEKKSKTLINAANIASKEQAKNRELQDTIRKQTEQINMLQKQLKKKELDEKIEKLGFEQLEDEEVRRVYRVISENIKTLGIEQAKARGINYIDLDNDGIDDRYDTFVDKDGDGKDDRTEDVDVDD